MCAWRPGSPRIAGPDCTHKPGLGALFALEDSGMALCLTSEELEELSGYRRTKEQRAWLDAQGIPYVLDRWRQPKVLRSNLEAYLTAGESATVQGPDLSRVR